MSFQDRQERKFDTPFFVIRNGGDIGQLRLFVRGNHYDVVEWGNDKNNSPLCRIFRNGTSRWPDRVATICVKRDNLLIEVKTTIDGHKK